jgi:hypothetical protein
MWSAQVMSSSDGWATASRQRDARFSAHPVSRA